MSSTEKTTTISVTTNHSLKEGLQGAPHTAVQGDNHLTESDEKQIENSSQVVAKQLSTTTQSTPDMFQSENEEEIEVKVKELGSSPVVSQEGTSFYVCAEDEDEIDHIGGVPFKLDVGESEGLMELNEELSKILDPTVCMYVL